MNSKKVKYVIFFIFITIILFYKCNNKHTEISKEKLCLDSLNDIFNNTIEEELVKFDNISFNNTDNLSFIYKDDDTNHLYFISLSNDSMIIDIAVELDSLRPFNEFYFCYSIYNPINNKEEIFIDYSTSVISNLSFLNQCGIKIFISNEIVKPYFVINTYNSKLLGSWKISKNYKYSDSSLYKNIEIDSNLIKLESDTFFYHKTGANILSTDNDSLLFTIISFTKNNLVIKFPKYEHIVIYDVSSCSALSK